MKAARDLFRTHIALRTVVAVTFLVMASAMLAEEIPPTVRTQGVMRIVFGGRPVSLTADVAGSAPLSYQWQINGTNLSGATDYPLTITNAQPTDSGVFRVIVQNSYGTATSGPIRLVVKPTPLVGSAVGWGDNVSGQTNPPAILRTNTILVSAGYEHGMALTSNGNVVVWGGYPPASLNPPTPLTNIVDVGAGSSHNIALRDDGTVVGWGWNGYGQAQVPAGLSNVIAISAGSYHNLALTYEGKVIAWGYNVYGQTNVPAGLGNITAISAGGLHSTVLKSDGSISVWGIVSNAPPGLPPLKAVEGGSDHTIGLTFDGTVTGWGIGGIPVQVPTNLAAATGIGAGNRHSLAIQGNGTVVGWSGSPSLNAQAQPPADLNGVFAVSGGTGFSLALTCMPIITSQPLGGSTYVGKTTTLSVAVASSFPVSYRWYHNGNGIEAATNASLVLSNVTTGNMGTYRVLIENGHGTNASRIVSLQVLEMRISIGTHPHENPQPVLFWGGGFILQTATNVNGPYVDIPGAIGTYPLTNMSAPQQFFRLRN